MILSEAHEGLQEVIMWENKQLKNIFHMQYYGGYTLHKDAKELYIVEL
jgi:hypothetical protein